MISIHHSRDYILDEYNSVTSCLVVITLVPSGVDTDIEECQKCAAASRSHN